MSKTPDHTSRNSFPESEIYTRLGVSAAKADVELAARALTAGEFPSAFCRILPDVFQGDPEYCVISHSDGAGSKSILAYLKSRQTGDASSFGSIAHDALIMNLDDVLCCGATTGFSYVSIINRHAARVGAEVVSAVIDGTLDSIAELARHGVLVAFCGGETADVGDVVQTILVDGALTTRLERRRIVRNELVPGHVIVGLSGYGPPATYEKSWNSGIGSNGVTLARRALLSPSVLRTCPEIAEASSNQEHVYFGKWEPEDLLPGSPATVVDALLSPTRTFAPILGAFLENHLGEVSGILHNTGGGQVKSLKAAHGVHIHKWIPVPLPPIFEAIRESTGLPLLEMAKVFNLGWRMEVYCTERAAKALIVVASEFNVEGRVLGRVEMGKPGERKLTLSIDGTGSTFES